MFTVVHLIPTGIGAAIGGFAGDATPVAHLLAGACDRLITHPNALNAAMFFRKPARALYVEGHALDQWLAGRWVLKPVRRQRIGLVVDRAIEQMPPGTLEALHNVVGAARAVHGLSLTGMVMTEEPLGCSVEMAESGCSVGRVARPGALLEAARALLAAGATAIAIQADLGPSDDSRYRAGQGVDPIGGLEAILSHLVVSELGVPAAHAPIQPFDPTPPPRVDPRAAAEYVGHSYLPCVLQGLSEHPDFAPGREAPPEAIVVPAGCLGGAGVLAAHARGVPILAVRENASVLGVGAAALGLPGVVELANYWEAAGYLLAMREGLDPGVCRRPLPSWGEIETSESGHKRGKLLGSAFLPPTEAVSECEDL